MLEAPHRSRRLLLAAFACALALAGCGGGGSEDEITAALQRTWTSHDDAACTEAQTQRFVEQTWFQQGPAALRACEKGGPGATADSVQVDDVQVDGDRATADTAISGSPYDGQTLATSLVRENGRWKADHLDSIPVFDRAALVAAMRRQLTQGGGIAPARVDCIAAKMQKAARPRLEALLLSGDPASFSFFYDLCG